MLTTQLAWHDTIGRQTVNVIRTDTTKVKAVQQAGEKLFAAYADFTEVDRERTTVRNDPRRLAHEAKLAAQEAGRNGEKVDAKKLRRKVRDAEEKLAEVELEWETAVSKLAAETRVYYAVIEHHAPALAHEARQDADAGILSLASASAIARPADAELSGALAILGGLESVVRDGAAFVPMTPKARNRQIGQGGVPGPYVGTALDGLGTAIMFATDILDELKKAEKKRAADAKVDSDFDTVVADPADAASDDLHEADSEDDE